MAIQKRDKYSLPFRIKFGSSYITDNDCDQMIIKVGSYSQKNPTYSNNAWQFELTQEMTEKLQALAPCQAQFTVDGSVYNSPVVDIPVLSSIITKEDEE